MNSRIALWLQEHFAFFKLEPLFKDLLLFLQGEMHETVLPTLSNDGGVSVVIKSGLGKVLYDKTKGKISKCVIEQVEFIPKARKSFSFTVVDNELSILRRNGSGPEYSPQVSIAEMSELSVFMSALRQKTEEFLRVSRT